MNLQITSLLAGIFAFMMVPLSLLVSLRRIKVADNDAADETLRRRIRAHGNFIEYVPTELIVVALIEYGGAARFFTISIATAFFVSRLSHAIGMLYTSSPALRAGAMLVQHIAFVASAAWLLFKNC